MKIEWNRRYTTIAIYAFLVVAASILFLRLIFNLDGAMAALHNLINILKPFIYGFVIAFILNPVLRFLDRTFLPIFFKDRNPYLRRGLAILGTFAFAVACFSVFFWFVIPQLVESITNLAGGVPGYLEELGRAGVWLVEKMSAEGMPPELYTSVEQTMQGLVNSAYVFLTNAIPQLINLTMGLTNGFINLIVGVIISVYMYMGKELFFAQSKKALYALFPREVVDKAIDLSHECNAIFSGFIGGKILDSLIIGIICFVCCWLMRMPYAMLISVIVGVTNVIPYFGPFFGAIPSVFIILTVSPVKALIFMVFVLVLQQFDGNILGPKILGQSTGLSAFWVIFSIMLFGKLFGFVGMFIGVPTFAVIYSLVRKFICARLQEKGLPIETASYTSQGHELLSAELERAARADKRKGD